MASPMPVLPLVGSTSVAPALSTPRRSASSTMASAIRSFTLPPGLSDSILASTVAPPGFGTRFSRTSGVAPISSRTEPAVRGRAGAAALLVVMARSCPGRAGVGWRRSDVIHGAGGTAPLGGTPAQVLEGRTIDDRGHRALDLPPQLAEPGRVLGRGATPAAPRRVRIGGRALHRPQERADRDLVGRATEAVAARGAAPRVEEPAALELEQHLLEVSLRDRLPRRDVLDRLQVRAVVQGQIHHRLDGVLALGRDPHARPCSRSR